MKKWILKAVVQKSISFLPYKNGINLLFQKYVTKGLDLNDEHFGYKITHGIDHINYLVKYRGKTNLDCLELGTGWYPIIPITLFLSGCNKTYTVDVTSHLTKNSIKATLDKFFEWEKKGQLDELFKIIKQENWRAIKKLYSKIDNLTLSEVLDILKIKPIVGEQEKRISRITLLILSALIIHLSISTLIY